MAAETGTGISHIAGGFPPEMPSREDGDALTPPLRGFMISLEGAHFSTGLIRRIR